VVEISLALGIFSGLACHEILGLSPGGIVVPGYLALFMDQPVRLLGTFLVSLITYSLIAWASGHVVLFGRRRFAVIMLTSFFLRWLWETAWIVSPVSGAGLRAIGYIVPGLMANEMMRQGVINTVCTVMIATSFVRIGLLVVEAWHLWI
jgi:poly-gamma-glutamate biosynthesis protein PgsC/CapC